MDRTRPRPPPGLRTESQASPANPGRRFPESIRVREADDGQSPRVRPGLAIQAPPTPVAQAFRPEVFHKCAARESVAALLGFPGNAILPNGVFVLLDSSCAWLLGSSSL